jgi:hypothetical protein
MANKIRKAIRGGSPTTIPNPQHLSASVIRICLLNLTAQLALGTAAAAQVSQATQHQPTITNIQKKCPSH